MVSLLSAVGAVNVAGATARDKNSPLYGKFWNQVVRAMHKLAFSAGSQLRDIIERNIDEIVSVGYLYRKFDKFPKDCCSETTHLLGHFLINQNICTLDQISTPWNNLYQMDEEYGTSHGWIRVDGALIVDITADQFLGINDRVIVSEDSAFHRRFISGEWVPFNEHHRRLTWQDDEPFKRVWKIVSDAAENSR